MLTGPTSAMLVQSESPGSTVTVTVPASWNGVECLLWNSQSDSDSAPQRPKYSWGVCGFRCALAAVQAAAANPASVIASEASAESSSTHAFELILLCTGGSGKKISEESFAVNSMAELQRWALGLMRLLTAVNDCAQSALLYSVIDAPAAVLRTETGTSLIPVGIDPRAISESFAIADADLDADAFSPSAIWVEAIYADGRPYFYCEESGSTAWELPAGVSVTPTALPFF